MTSITIEGEIPESLMGFDAYQVYNVLDSAVTAQLLPVMRAKLGNTHATIYSREMTLQSLCLDMSCRGFPIDEWALAELLWQLDKDTRRATAILHRFCAAVNFPPLNPNSPKQVAELFYTHLNLPTQYEYDRKKGVRKVSTDRRAMEKLSELYPIAVPFVNALDAAKTSAKLASVFRRGLEPGTQRLRCNVSPSGTETGRLSSQQNPYGRGTNAQNLTDRARQVITAPPGYCIINLDLKTAESIAVGYLSGDRNYISACLSGDLHTSVAKLTWPHLAWTGDLKEDRAIADGPYYRIFSYRDMAKRGGHGTNYYGTPRTMAQHLKVQTRVIETFQAGYFSAFPGLPTWHLRVIAEVQATGTLTTPMGRERRFWGRSDDPATHREAIAFGPQSLVADVWNNALIALQRWLILRQLTDQIHLLMQVHDSVVICMPIELVHDLVPQMQRVLEYPVDFGQLGTMVIPTDATIGRRWNKKPKKGGTRAMLQGQQDYIPGMSLDFLLD